MIYRLTIEEVCRKLKPIFGSKIDDVYLKYSLAEREEKEEIVQFLNALYNKNLGALLEQKVLLEPPREKVIDGTYPLADIIYADKKLFPFKLREQDWPRHVCISGMSGSGKTTFSFNILCQFIEKNKPFLVFDWKKSFRPLLLKDPEIVCFTIGNDEVSNVFKMNINQPPKGIDPKEWINILCDLLVESFSASFGVHKALLETLDYAFESWGVYEGSENYPTWEHIKWLLEERLQNAKSRESGWIESALRIATVLTFGNFGKVCNYKEEGNLNVGDLLDKKVIFELNSLGNVEKKFFCEFVLTYIYKLKKSGKGNAGEKFESAILVDEAHNIFLKKPTSFSMESVTDMVYREMREYGISLICLDQHISKLSDTIKGNSACHVAFQQQLPQDIFDISGLMQLKDNQQFFSMLPVGSAIVKLAERYTFPFLIKVSKVDFGKEEVTDKKIKSRSDFFVKQIGLGKGNDEKFLNEMKGQPRKKEAKEIVEKESESIGSLKTYPSRAREPLTRLNEGAKSRFRSKLSPREEFDSVQRELYDFVNMKLKEGKKLREIEDLLERKKDRGGYSVRDIGVAINRALENQMGGGESKIYKSKNPKKDGLVEEQEMFLGFLKKNPKKDYGTTAVYNELGLSSRKGNEVKNKLLDKGLIKIEEVKSAKGWKKIIRAA